MAGHVVRVRGTDSVAAPGIPVVFHRISATAQGPLDSMPAGPGGRFHFRFPEDTSAVYLLSARFAGIEFFSQPLRVGAAKPVTGILLVVTDTSDTATIRMQARYVVIRKPEAGGFSQVLDLRVLHNPGGLTRISADTTRPSWAGPLPPEAAEVQAGESDFSPEAVETRNDSLLVFAPIPPGDKQVSAVYIVPAGVRKLTLRFPEGASSAQVLLEDPAASVTGALALADSQVLDNRTFHRWTGALPAEAVVSVGFPAVKGAGAAARWVLPLLVGLMGIALFGVILLYRRRRPAVPVRSPVDLLTDRIAELDARYGGREGQVAAKEWDAYQAERRDLLAQVDAHLAGRRPPA